MDYQALVEEIAKEQYAGLSDQEVADLLNAATIAAVRNVPTSEVATWAAENGVMAGLFALERSPETQAELYGVIKTLLTILDRLDEWRILDNDGKPTPAAQAMIDVLIQAGVMSEAQASELMAMAVVMTSWAAQNWTGQIGAHHVAETRHGE